jgi:hypothetical protein
MGRRAAAQAVADLGFDRMVGSYEKLILATVRGGTLV